MSNVYYAQQVSKIDGEVADTTPRESDVDNTLADIASAGMLRDMLGLTDEFTFVLIVESEDGDLLDAYDIDTPEDLHRVAGLL